MCFKLLMTSFLRHLLEGIIYDLAYDCGKLEVIILYSSWATWSRKKIVSCGCGAREEILQLAPSRGSAWQPQTKAGRDEAVIPAPHVCYFEGKWKRGSSIKLGSKFEVHTCINAFNTGDALIYVQLMSAAAPPVGIFIPFIYHGLQGIIILRQMGVA